MFKVRLPFFEMAGEIGSESASVDAGGGEPLGDGSAPTPDNTTDTTSAPSDDVVKQESFAKRLKEQTERALAEERSKWEQENADRYKDFDVYKKAAEFMQKQNGIQDVMTLKEQLEMADLQERADRSGLDPEMQRRFDELEAKANRLDEIEQERQAAEQQRQEQEQLQQYEKTYWDGLNQFAKDRGVESNALNQFMVENNFFVNPENLVKSFEIAHKAMDYDNMAKRVEEAEKAGMKKLISAKGSIPHVPSSTNQGQVVSSAPKTFAEARQRAMQRGL